MNEAFIWLSGHRIIDREILMAINFYRIFSKTFSIPEAKGLIQGLWDAQRGVFSIKDILEEGGWKDKMQSEL